MTDQGEASNRPISGWGPIHLEQLRESLQEFAHARDWEQFHTPRNLLLALVGEVGELSELFQWKGEVSRGVPEFKPSEKLQLRQELADVLLYLIRLADVCEVDLGQAAVEKMKENAAKYPANRCKGSADKYTAYQDADMLHQDSQAAQAPTQQAQDDVIQIMDGKAGNDKLCITDRVGIQDMDAVTLDEGTDSQRADDAENSEHENDTQIKPMLVLTGPGSSNRETYLPDGPCTSIGQCVQHHMHRG